jgi:TfoX/Sxy family transcriptional regulator of competence genes
MPVDQALAKKLRAALAKVPGVVEQPMFGGLAFLVQGKMCINVSRDGLMCRIDPSEHEKVIQRPGWSTVVMRNKPLQGYIRVNSQALAIGKTFQECVKMALAYNQTLVAK